MTRNKSINKKILWFTFLTLLEIGFLLTAYSLSVMNNLFGINTLTPVNQKIWDGGSKEYVAKSVAVGEDGCIYITGYFKADPNTPYDVFVRKYEKDYTFAWEIIWGEDDLNDKAEDIAIDSEGLIVITGGREHSPKSNNYNGFIAFFEPINGFQKGNKTSAHDWSQYLWGIDVSLDPNLKLAYTAGDSYYNTFGDYDALYIIWNYTDMSDIKPYITGYFLGGHPGGLMKNDRAYDIKIEANNGFIIVGETESLGAGMADAFIALYRPTVGYTNFIHINHKTWGTFDNEYFHGIVLEKPSDPNSPIYACGAINRSSDLDYEAALVKYDPTFIEDWARTHKREINETYFDVIMSSDDYLYTTGFSYKTDSSSADVLTSRFNVAGDNLENNSWNNKDDDHGYGIIEGKNKEIFVTGGTNFSTTTQLAPTTYGDAFLLVYNVTTPIATTTTTTTTTMVNTTTTTTSGTPGFTFITFYLSLMTIAGTIVILRRRKKQ